MSPWAGSAAFTHRRQETGAFHWTRQPLCVSEAKLAAAILPVSGPRGGTPRQHQNDDQRRTPTHPVARVFRRSEFREFPSNSPQCRRDRRREHEAGPAPIVDGNAGRRFRAVLLLSPVQWDPNVRGPADSLGVAGDCMHVAGAVRVLGFVVATGCSALTHFIAARRIQFGG